jgi:hypothetical protein
MSSGVIAALILAAGIVEERSFSGVVGFTLKLKRPV